MVQIKFAPLSGEKEIPGTEFKIQIGVIQNETRSWGVKLSHGGKIIAAKRIKKLIDVEIVGIIRDTIGKKVALDTFELGSAMSALLREVYEKLQAKQDKPKPQEAAPKATPPPRPAPTPAPQPQPPGPRPTPQQPAESMPALDEINIPASQPLPEPAGDSFWSSYSSLETAPAPAPQQPAPVEPPATQPTTPTASSDLDDAFAILGVSCPSCGREVDPDLETCPYCGQKL